MNKILPYATDVRRGYGRQPLQTLDPHSAEITGPTLNYRHPKLVSSGILADWDADAARVFLAMPTTPELWDMSWSNAEQFFADNVKAATTPEEVEALLPGKWLGYKATHDYDESLARVCKLCTAIVNRFLALSQDNACDKSSSKWRQHQVLLGRIRAVMEVLEASIGESISVNELRNEAFVRSCWSKLADNDKQDVLSVLSHENDNN